MLREEMKNLLRWQVLAQDRFDAQMRASQDRFDRAIAKVTEKLDGVGVKLDEAADKLNGLIAAVELMRENFDQHLKRLEGEK